MGEELGIDLIDEDMDWEPDRQAPSWMVKTALVLGVLLALSVVAVILALTTNLFDGNPAPQETEGDLAVAVAVT